VEKETAWIDRNYKHYHMSEIEDGHLINILGFMTRGGGYAHFLTNSKIKALFNEANKRGLSHEHSLNKAIEMREEKDFITEMDRIGFHEEDFW
jgi:hypothetical protein